MSNVNKFVLSGRLTRDPEIKTVNGNNLVEFSLANGRKYKSSNETKEEVNYFDCQAWGKLADVIAKYCSKGKQIIIDGRIKQQRWEKDGKKHSKQVFVVENLEMIGNKDKLKSPDSFDDMGTESDEDPF